jgi:GT2 family glycosyltransferase
MKHPLVSFIIPLFNHLDKTREMLSSLKKSMPDGVGYEIILCDDFSTDDTRQWLKQMDDPHVVIQLNDQNRGYGYTSNMGARLAKGDFLALLNNDLILRPGWLEPMLEVYLSSNLSIGVLGNIQYRLDTGDLDHAGMDINLSGQFEHVRDLSVYEASLVQVFGVTGACMLLRRSDFEQVGGFDEKFINGCEDLDLSFKLAELGKPTYLCIESSVHHHVGLSRDVTAPQNQKNSQYLYEKWDKHIHERLRAKWEAEFLINSGGEYACIDGSLEPNFMIDKALASKIVADAVLAREWCNWALSLNSVESVESVDHILGENFIAKGLLPVESMNSYLAEGIFSIDVSNLKSIRNFYVCGRKINAQVSGPMAITISIDGLHRKTTILRRGEGNINVGIINPILLPQPHHSFKVRIDYIDDADLPVKLADKAVLITHLVVDDVVVKNITLHS